MIIFYHNTFLEYLCISSIQAFCLLLSFDKLNKKSGFNQGVINLFCIIAVSLKKSERNI